MFERFPTQPHIPSQPTSTENTSDDNSVLGDMPDVLDSITEEIQNRGAQEDPRASVDDVE